MQENIHLQKTSYTKEDKGAIDKYRILFYNKSIQNSEYICE